VFAGLLGGGGGGGGCGRRGTGTGHNCMSGRQDFISFLFASVVSVQCSCTEDAGCWPVVGRGWVAVSGCLRGKKGGGGLLAATQMY